jgi:hypothetical protein
MKLKNIGSNMTEVETSDGTLVLFSYSTPVACFVPAVGYMKTDKKWSATTSRHINKWTGANCESRPQSYFDSII